MLLKQRNRNRLHATRACYYGCCDVFHSDKRGLRRYIRRVEKQQWRKAVKNDSV